MGKGQHGHSHDGPHQADLATKANAATEFVTGFISDFYWMATFVDFCREYSGEVEEDFLGVSWAGLLTGLLLASLSAAGSTYCHYILNKNHQGHSEHKKEHSFFRYASFNFFSKQEITLQKVPTKRPINEEIDVRDSTPFLEKEHASTTWYQKLALAGDFISHVGDYAGPLTFVTALATKNYKLTWFHKAIVQSTASLVGAVASYADVRTCKNNIEASNGMNMKTTSQGGI